MTINSDVDGRQSTGVPPSGSGCSAEPEPSFTVSAVPVSIPNAVAELRRNAESLGKFVRSYQEHEHEERFWGRYTIDAQIGDIFQLVGRLAASIERGLQDAASAIEARTER